MTVGGRNAYFEVSLRHFHENHFIHPQSFEENRKHLLREVFLIVKVEWAGKISAKVFGNEKASKAN